MCWGKGSNIGAALDSRLKNAQSNLAENMPNDGVAMQPTT
jgi:hypothetical protein